MTTEMKDLPIGVFDSGLGGLTVVHALRRKLPGERIVYLGDNARVPYGTRSPATIIRYAERCASFLVLHGLKMLALACNTASAVALPTLQNHLKIPVLGVIRAGARAVAKTKAQRIGVIGTAGTVRSGAYLREIAALTPDKKVMQNAAPLLVPLAEEGWTEGRVPKLAAIKYLRPLAQKEIEVLLLGCTHYPLLKSTIQEALDELACNATVIDSASAMAVDIEDTLETFNLRRSESKGGELLCFVTDRPTSFEDQAIRFLGEKPNHVEVIDLE